MKLPYGQSNFHNVATAFYYVDRTQYIEALEQQANRFLFFLRPRKFGKSLCLMKALMKAAGLSESDL